MWLLREPLHFYRFAFISALAPTLCSLVETSELPELKLSMKSQDFEYILSWEGNFTGGPVYYSVKYASSSSGCLTSQTSSEKQKSSSHRTRLSEVVECSNVTRSFCNLTKEFTNPCKTYMIFVETMTENGTKYPFQNGLYFIPYVDTCLSPPQFNVSACPKCANVTVKVLSSVLKLYEELKYIISVTTGGSKVKEESIRKKQESFYHIVEDLKPNTNYCISVEVFSSQVNKCYSSPPKCIIRNSNKNPDFPVFLAPILVVVVGLTLFGMYQTGFICLRIKEWPKALKFTLFVYSVFEPEPEELHSGQITICESQKSKNKEWGYNYGDDSESDVENDGLYTNRKTLGKTSESCSDVTVAEQISTGSFSAMNETELLDAEATTIQNDHNREDNTVSKIIYPSPEVSSTDVPEPEHCSCLNVNLNTVVLRTSGENENIAETLILFKEDTSDLKESCAFKPSDPSEPENIQDVLDVQNSGVDNFLHTWQNSNWTAESESSDSELDTGNGYLRR